MSAPNEQLIVARPTASLRAVRRGGSALPEIEPATRPASLPLSYAQERLWFLHQFEPLDASFHLAESVELEGPLSTSRLTAALDEIRRRHEVLRTTFSELADQPVQVISPSRPVPLPIVDLRSLPSTERDLEAEDLLDREARRPLDLVCGPLLRTVLLRLEGERHWLLVVAHPAVFDAESMALLLRELVALYRALSTSQPSPLNELPVQYADYAIWQRRCLAAGALKDQLEYWRQRLAGAPSSLELATDAPRPARQSFRGAELGTTLAGSLAHRLEALGRRHGATLFITLLAAFEVVLRRHTGLRDIVVGSPISNRSGVETEGLIGFLTNTLVLRTRLTGDPTFERLLEKVIEATQGAYDHRELPFEQLVEELQPERDFARQPLFQVLFAVEPQCSAVAMADLKARRGKIPSRISKFDLSVVVEPGETGLGVSFEYCTDLFAGSTVRRFLGHYSRVLEGITSHPQRRLSELPLLTQGERQQVMVEWADTARPESGPRLVHEMFEHQVRLAPAAIAVATVDEVLSYGELDRQAALLAGRLQRLGVGPDRVVALALERTPQLAIAVLGVLKAGAAYLSLDPSYPLERLRYMLRDALSPVLVTDRHAELARPGMTVVKIETGADEVDPVPPPKVLPADGENLTYIIYTSGSTGQPKGIAMRHRALCNLIRWQISVSGAGAGTRTLQFAALSFDVSFQEMLATWATGGALVLVPSTVRSDVAKLGAYLESQRIERLFLPFIALQQLAQWASESKRSPSALREVVTAGETLQVTAPVVELFERLPSCQLDNQYGPSEAHVVTAYRLRGKPSSWPTLPSIGRGVVNLEIRLMDRGLQPMGIGSPGELTIGGAGLARGYLGRPAQTAVSFVPDAWSGELGARIYRTGDLARCTGDGTLMFLGRLDHQAKVRGYRIEPGEIEAALAAHPAVREAAVAIHELAPGDRGLVAYWVSGDKPATRGELRTHLADRLPEYMMPAVLIELEALPRTPSGKVDRGELPRPEAGQARATAPYVAPRTPVEEMLTSIWSEVLGVERVGVDDDFFALGGHSLLATRVLSRLRQDFAVEVPMMALFEHSTVGALSAQLGRVGQSAIAPALQPVARRGSLPLSFAQERLWFLEQLEPGAAYNMPHFFELKGSLCRPALEAAVDQILRRHEVLRTTFPEAADQPVQAIAAARRVHLPLVDVSTVPVADRDREIRRLFDREARRGFDLARGPLLRIALLRLTNDHHRLLLFMHHIVGDGWSLGVLHHELTSLYQAAVDGRPSPLAEPPVQYADYAVWQREWLAGEALVPQLEYWRQRLAGAPTSFELATDHPRPTRQSFRGAELGATVQVALLGRLIALSQSHGATLFMTLLAAFQTVLRRHTGEHDVVVGSPISNRTRIEVEGLIGFFTNTVVLRTELAGDPTFEALLADVIGVTLGAHDHQELPFERLVEELRPERDLSRSPLFQILFQLFDGAAVPSSPPGLDIRLDDVATGTSKFDLNLFLEETDAGLGVSLEYCTDLFDRSTVQRLLGHFCRMLEGVVEHPDRRLSELPMLAASEHQQVVVEWAEPALSEGESSAVHLWFERQVRRTPEAPAVAQADETLSYGELDRRAEELAQRLRRLGVGPDSVVALAMERTPRLAVAVLGALKAGAAYLPLDPGYPQERLQFMLQDSASPVLVTDRYAELAVPGMAVVSLMAVRPVAESATAAPGPHAAAPIDGENLAYVLYTSGSTGRPKGVAMRHRALSNLIRWQLGTSSSGLGSRTLQFAALSFDVSFQEMLATWAAGGTLVLVPQVVRTDVATLGAYLESQRVERLFLPFIALQQLARWAADSGAVPSTLREVMTAGEALQVTAPVADFFTRLESCRLENQYGPTETHVVTAHRLAGGPASWPTLPSIGRGITNLEIRLLDRQLQPLGIGVAGELAIGGTGLARGYLGRPALTAERFVPDAWSGHRGARLYRTGDLARATVDGTVAFLGRLDHQVKVRGYRIEPGEIEAALAAHPGVREAAVAVRELAPGDFGLAAYWVAAEDASTQGAMPEAGARHQLRAHLAGRLPDHMVPAAWVELEALPRTPSGKVDRRRLPRPETDPSRATAPYVAPRTPTEELLAGIWSEVLGIAQVGVDDNFFTLGGHSLLATRVLSRLRKIFSVELPMNVLFEQPTIQALAAAIEAASREDHIPPLEPRTDADEVPLSFAQERFWFLEQLSRGANTYSVPYALLLKGPLKISALERAFSEVLRRHEVLRASFPSREGRPSIRFADWRPRSIPRIDLEGLRRTDQQAQLQRQVNQDTLRPFDVARGPLARITLVRLTENRHGLLLNLHHIVADGWSLRVLIREMVKLYDAFIQGHPSPLPPLRLQYGDFAHWQRSWLRGEALEAMLGYWQRQLGERPPALVLPGQRQPSPGQAPRPVADGFELPVAVGEALEKLSRDQGVTLFMTGLAAFAAVLGRYAGLPRVFLGTPIANRNRVETEKLIGCFINTLVLPIDLSGDPGFDELLARVRSLCLGAYAHEDLPFEKLVEAYNPDRGAQNPLFHAFFSLSVTDLFGFEVEGLEFRPLESQQAGMLGAKFDLSASMTPSDSGLAVGLAANSVLYPEELAASLLSDFRRLLIAIADHPERKLSKLPGLDEGQRQALAKRLATDLAVTDPPKTVAPRAEAPAVVDSEERQVASRRARLEQSLAMLPPALRARFAARLAKKPTAARPAPTIPRRKDPGPAPLSLAQERLWFLDRLDPSAPTYNVPVVARLRGELDVGALVRALRAVVGRHEVLRATFTTLEDGTPTQETGPLPVVVLPVIDLRGLANSVARALLRSEAVRPFDLERGPVARFLLLRLSTEDAYLALSFHHIVFDAGSSQPLFGELVALYEAERAGRPSPLAELPAQYADFAVWQRRGLTGERLERQLAYWRQQLDQVPATLALPRDRPAPEVQTFRGSRHEFRLPRHLAPAIARLRESSQATLFMVLMASFQAFLHRLSGETDVTVGTAVSGRGRREIEGLIGFFVNTLALRVQLGGGLTFRETLDRVRRTTLEAYEHQDVPLSRLVEELQPERVAGQAPFFQTVLMVESAVPGVEMGNSRVEIETLSPPVAKSDLTLAFVENADGFDAVIEYNTDLFDLTTMRRWAAGLTRLLDAATADPDRRLVELPMIGEVESQAILREWNDTAAVFPRDATFHGLFERQCQRTPDAIALVGGAAGDQGAPTIRLSFGALDRHAEGLARRLASLGVGPESIVGLCLEPSVEMVVALFGILKAGGAYLPIDPDHPAERMAFQLNDAGVEIVVTEPRFESRWQERALRTVCVTLELQSRRDACAPSDLAELESQSRPDACAVSDSIVRPAGPENLAYIIYTSGSTGQPKGVMVRHRSIANLFGMFHDRILNPFAGRQLRVALMSSLVFDASVAQLLALAEGHTLHVVSNDARRDAALMVRQLRQQPLDVLNFTPSHLRVAIGCGLLSEPRLTPCLLLAGGEEMGDDLRQQLAETSGLTAYNMYGPTESTVDACGGAVRAAIGGRDVGRPIANHRIDVLDAADQRVPIGTPGELWIAGFGLARGYLARPGLTAERFSPDDRASTPGARRYRTGDRARWLPAGRLEFLGRFDDQVKVRGFRIELGEVEAALVEHPAVEQGVAILRRDASDDPRLVAYVTSGAEASVDPTELRRFLSRRLPDYMVPSAIVVLEAFPRTAGDKVDRRALPAPDDAAQAGSLAPRDELELRLVRLWQDVLDRPRIGVDDDFFALGGHSLLAVQLMSRLEQELGVRLPLSALFKRPTVEALAGRLRRQDANSDHRPARVELQQGGRERPFFCVHPVGGNVFCYVDLARGLGSDRPFHGLQTPEPVPWASEATVEEMAASYVDAVRQVQADGPYALGGWSMGGLIAFEMARQLMGKGQQVATLALIDIVAPSPDTTPAPIDDGVSAAMFARDLAGLWGIAGPSAEDFAGLSADDALQLLLERAEQLGGLPPGLELAYLRRLYGTFISNLRAASRYVPRPYNDHLTLFRATASGKEPADPTLGWGALARGGVELRTVAGDHYTMLREPQVAGLAADLRHCLASSAAEGKR